MAGRGDEVSGFALAGVETARCDSPADADRLVGSLADESGGVGLLIVSPWVERHAARAIAAARRHKGPPVIVVVPDPLPTGD